MHKFIKRITISSLFLLILSGLAIHAPEAVTMLLLGVSLVGVASSGRKKDTGKKILLKEVCNE